MATTAWGEAKVVESVSFEQRGGGRAFATRVELLEGEGGECLVRFSYSTDGVARRGPVTLRRGDLATLKKALRKAPRLRAMLEEGVGR
ncbi:MAG: hypothetical protein JST00_12440 [Deltaproteobacteria bacterium]|nr:hypothetical protein [Deltaproteobacteria bacterium]